MSSLSFLTNSSISTVQSEIYAQILYLSYAFDPRLPQLEMGCLIKSRHLQSFTSKTYPKRIKKYNYKYIKYTVSSCGQAQEGTQRRETLQR